MPKSGDLPPLEWEGFDDPSYTQVPDALFDVLLPYLSDAELRVLLYLIRRTFGFKKRSDAVSLSQIVNGIVKKDGERLDHGAGLSKNAACVAIKKLEAKSIILAERQQSAARGFEATTYSVRMRGMPLSFKRTSLVMQDDKAGQVVIVDDKASHKAGQALVLPDDQQQTVVQETVQQEGDSNPVPRTKREIAGERPPYSPYIAGVVLDDSTELGDTTHGPSNVTQALRLWTQSGSTEAAFVAHLHEARRLTRLYQGKQGLGTITNKMAYYFQVVRDLVQQSAGMDTAAPDGVPSIM